TATNDRKTMPEAVPWPRERRADRGPRARQCTGPLSRNRNKGPGFAPNSRRAGRAPGVGSPSALAQQRVGAWVVGAAEVLAQGIGEQRLVRGGVPEQGHARAELEVVRRAKQRVRIVTGAQREPGAFAQAF